MKAVILAGGLGTRLSEETVLKPKPMVEIGGFPILWHIMKYYSTFGVNEFVVCLGYKGYIVKEYFANYFMHMSDVSFDLSKNEMTVHRKKAEDWVVTLIDTGADTMTGGRIKRIKNYVGDETFCLTYGDGVTNLNLKTLIDFHKKNKKKATVTSVQPPGRFGALNFEGDTITSFMEKPDGDGAWINGGFFVCEPDVFDYIEGDETIWEQAPLMNLAKEGNLVGYKHTGFWHAMDTLRDKRYLEGLWTSGEAPWSVW